MNIDPNWKLGLGIILHNLFCYSEIRSQIWSIVQCDRNSNKTRRFSKWKRNHSLWSRIRQRDFIQYVNDHVKEFRTWMLIKEGLVIATVLFLIIGIPFALTGRYWGYFWVSFLCFVPFSIVFFIIYDTNHNTKYDRIRINKKNRRNRRKK